MKLISCLLYVNWRPVFFNLWFLFQVFYHRANKYCTDLLISDSEELTMLIFIHLVVENR